MKDDFEVRVGAWLRERARPDPASLDAVRGAIDDLPARHRGPRRVWLATATAVVFIVAIGATAVLVLPRPSGGSPGLPVPPDPAAFAGDPRLGECFAGAGPVEFAFEMRHARDYPRHFPAMLLSPELDVDDPAFAVVFASGAQLLIGGGGPPAPSGGPTTSSNPNERSVCILVGGTPNLYENVDISGMRVDLGDPATGPSEPPTPLPKSSTGPTQTPAPAELDSSPRPPDPAAFDGDPRFDACVGTGAAAVAALHAFEVPHARDVPRYLPGLQSMIGGDTVAATFVVIYRDMIPAGWTRGGSRPEPGDSPRPARSQVPGTHDVCVLVGPVVGGSKTIYVDVSMAGFDANPA